MNQYNIKKHPGIVLAKNVGKGFLGYGKDFVKYATKPKVNSPKISTPPIKYPREKHRIQLTQLAKINPKGRVTINDFFAPRSQEELKHVRSY